MLSGEGLQPSSKGAKVRYSNGKITVIDGPFTESKELVAGFSMMQAKSLDEVVELSKRWPKEDGDVELRIRQVLRAKKTSAPSSRRSCGSRRSGSAAQSAQQQSRSE